MALFLTARFHCPLYFDGEFVPRLGLSALGAALSGVVYPPETTRWCVIDYKGRGASSVAEVTV